MLVRQCATLTEHGECVFEPTLLSDQGGDPWLSADAASQSLQAQPPELRGLVPALRPAEAHLDRAGARAGVQGAAEEPESRGEEAPLTGFSWKITNVVVLRF